MDEQNKPKDDDESQKGESDISLGSGVDIVQSGGGDDVDDVEIESYNDDVSLGGSPTPEEKIKRLREKLKQCNTERQEYLDGWQRLKADFVNYKKRAEDERSDFLKFAREDLITDLLPVLESFHMAFANKEAWEKVDKNWRMGVEHIHSQLMQSLATHGLTEVVPKEGDDFDPKEETAIDTVPCDDPSKAHKIAEVVQVGYKLAGKVIKSPKVKVYGESATNSS